MEEPFNASESNKEQMQKLLTPEELGRKALLSTAFVRLVIECGCPTVDGKLSHKMFVTWLPEHFGRVRDLAGLDPLPAPAAATNEQERAEFSVNGYLRTIIDFAESRCSDRQFKEAYASIRKRMDEWPRQI